MTQHLGHRSFEHLVEGVVRDWAARHPLTVKEVRRAANRLKEIRGNDKGHMVDGYLKGGLPESLGRAMKDKFGVCWQGDKTIHDIFWRVFEIGRFNTYERAR